MDNPVAKALHDGLDTLRLRGMGKWVLCDELTGQVCARGALLVGAGLGGNLLYLRENEVLGAADRLLCAVAVEQYPERTGQHGPDFIAHVNNHDDTTQEDVERIFEKAIVKAYETP